MIQLVAFDLDGTLVDSRRDLADTTNALISELGGLPLEDDVVARMVGEGAAVLVRKALTAAALDPSTPGALERFLSIYDDHLLNNTAPYSGTTEMLIRLAGRQHLSVLTNKPAQPTTRLLEALGLLALFDGVVGGDTPLGRKPEPDGLLHLIERAGTTPAATMLVGDSAIDLATARRAGSRICLARYGFGYRFTNGDLRGDEYFIDAPSELPGLLASITA